MSMFCYQCQETARNQGCTVRGVCGKTEDVAILQDLLIYLLKGLSFYSTEARKRGHSDAEVDRFVLESLFSTITNVNFDAQDIADRVYRALALRERIRQVVRELGGLPANLPDAATWAPEDDKRETLLAKGAQVGILADKDEDIRSLRWLIVYGLKGLCAYADHALILGKEDAEVHGFVQSSLAATLDDTLSADDLVGLALKVGEYGIRAMALLDEANTSRYGHPEPTVVNLGVKPGPAILVSGHDLLDLEELLEQTKGKGVNVYTHGEMLPAHAYPFFKKYEHLVGNYGGSWWRQDQEFEKFGGAILMTTNCLVPPKESYADRVFTTGVVGYPGLKYIPDRVDGKPKDFSPVIAKALESDSPQELESGTITIGFARQTIMSVVDKVLAAIQQGAIKRFVVMAGCDGRQRARQYFTEVAEALPQDTVILTAGCAKYRYNKLDLGDIGGIPRVLDAGQCNDSYSLAYVALQLKEAVGAESLNDLPIVYDIGWYEQKAVLVLLALLSLGVKKIRLGPTLPAFLSPNVAKVLVDKFEIQPTTTVEADVAAMLA
ncbi:MAG: hydroxylamine reductase [Chloroflexi bacterium]|nr:hydroxylamine reductase [Chloroflexota bacterium]